MVNNVSIEEVFNDVIRFRPIKHNDDRGFFSEIYREDLCLAVAEMIQDEVPSPTPIDPV